MNEWISVWTQLRHLSHIDCKTGSQIECRKGRCRGDTGRFDGLAVNTSSVTNFSLPTLRNLAGMPLAVNPFGCVGARQRTPSLVTRPGYLRYPEDSLKCDAWVPAE